MLNKLFRTIGYRFNDERLAQQALTHRSHSREHNERLEFLGDALLGAVIAEQLFQRFPEAKEGQLTRIRSNLVKGDTLAEIAREFNFSDYLKLGGGELKSGGFRRTSILADALEAMIAAIYLDSDIETCQKTILEWYESRLQATRIDTIEKDHKTKLQEWLQSKGLALPQYSVTAETGDAHEKAFTVECLLPHNGLSAKAESQNKRKAEKLAAAEVIKKLKI